MKIWAHHAPMNHLHKWHLVEAEKARILNKHEEAKNHYKKAIEGAHTNEYVQEEALAYELYARFLLNTGETKFAAYTMKEAYYCYSIWGALAKLTHMEKTYSDLLKESTETMISIKNKKISSSSLTTGLACGAGRCC